MNKKVVIASLGIITLFAVIVVLGTTVKPNNQTAIASPNPENNQTTLHLGDVIYSTGRDTYYFHGWNQWDGMFLIGHEHVWAGTATSMANMEVYQPATINIEGHIFKVTRIAQDAVSIEESD